MRKQSQCTHIYLNASVILSSSHNKHPQGILWDKWSLSYHGIFQVQLGQFGSQGKKEKENSKKSAHFLLKQKKQSMWKFGMRALYCSFSDPILTLTYLVFPWLVCPEISLHSQKTVLSAEIRFNFCVQDTPKFKNLIFIYDTFKKKKR